MLRVLIPSTVAVPGFKYLLSTAFDVFFLLKCNWASCLESVLPGETEKGSSLEADCVSAGERRHIYFASQNFVHMMSGEG